MRRLLLVVCMCVLPSMAFAASGWTPRRNFKNLGTLQTNTDVGNGALSAITFSNNNADRDPTGYSVLVLVADHADGDATTDITMSCTGSLDGGTTKATYQSCSVASGVCTSSDASWLKDNSTSGTWIWRVDMLGMSYVECTFTVANSGVATNDLTITGAMSDG